MDNNDYLFDHFVSGPENQLAVNACKAVAEHYDKAFNPLFICGPAGSGRTTLVLALKEHAEKVRKNVKVSYMDTLDFSDA